VAVQAPLHTALHFVVQSAVVETATHCVLQWSSQQELQEAWQSVDDDADAEPPSEEDIELVVHEALQVESQRELQSVVQSKVGGDVVQLVEQSD
jgi:hypothetical protein